MATRLSSPYDFDHGAQFFTAKSLNFKNFIEPLIKKGITSMKMELLNSKIIKF